MSPRQLGSYELLSRIGHGGMGEVWRARHVMLGRLAAVKLVRPDALARNRDLMVRRFEQEARTTSKLTSTHTIQLYDFGVTTKGVLYYAMELLDGIGFDTLIARNGPIEAARTAFLLHQVCESLEEAHDNGLIHRDIKPANLFLCRLGTQVDFVKVLDFGIAKSLAPEQPVQLTAESVLPGSPGFIAPEQIESGAVSPASDIYALGCVAYWLLTGQLVFARETTTATVMAHVNETPDPPSSRSELPISAAVDDVIMRCLEKSPGARPASARELSHLLAACDFERPWSHARAQRWWDANRPETWVHHETAGDGDDVADLGEVLVPSTLPDREITTPDRPSIVVLPFENMSGDPEQGYFSDGITEDITTDLSQLSGMFVIARNTAFAYRGSDERVSTIASELGVRFVLTGSIRKAGPRVRITATLVDGQREQPLWARRYDRQLEDVFAVQDEVTKEIVAALKVELSSADEDRLNREGHANVEAYDHLLRARESLLAQTETANAECRDLLNRALVLDPEYASALAELASCHLQAWQQGWSGLEDLQRAHDLARRAVAIDEGLAQAHDVLGQALLWMKRHDDAIAAGEKAVALDPNDPDCLMGLASIVHFAGQQQRSLKLIRQAMRLNPHYPPWYLAFLGFTNIALEDYVGAREAFEQAVARHPESATAAMGLIAACELTGDHERACAGVAEVMRINPSSTRTREQEHVPYRDPEPLQRLLDAWQRAGLP